MFFAFFLSVLAPEGTNVWMSLGLELQAFCLFLFPLPAWHPPKVC